MWSGGVVTDAGELAAKAGNTGCLVQSIVGVVDDRKELIKFQEVGSKF